MPLCVACGVFLRFAIRGYSYRNRLVFTMKQLVQHGKNLGMFVGIYKAICYVLRRMGVDGGLECWIAGAHRTRVCVRARIVCVVCCVLSDTRHDTRRVCGRLHRVRRQQGAVGECK